MSFGRHMNIHRTTIICECCDQEKPWAERCEDYIWFRRWFGARWAMRRGPVMGYHAVSILGASSKGGGYVVIENSRGLSWGNKGTARLSWIELEQSLSAGELFAYGIDFNEATSN